MNAQILELCRADSRFAYEAYEFVCDAVTYTQDRLGRAAARGRGAEGRRKPADDSHVSGAELVRGACELAVREFGMMAPVVFKQWGIKTTDDIGEIVFKLIGAEQLSKSDRDDVNDFRGLFDLHQALADGFTLTLDAPAKRGDR